MNEQRAMVRLSAITKGYGSGSARVEVLRNLDLELAEGEMLAVVGASGVGKSTLLHIVGLLDRQESGSVQLDGQTVDGFDGERRARLRNQLMGFVFQHHHLLDEFDARDNIALPLRIAGQARRPARLRAMELLAAVGLTDRSSHFPDQLSGGERQRVAVARALAANPRLLLADEPTGNLDQSNAEKLFELLQELHLKAGLTSIIVTHNEAMAGRCDRVFRLAPRQQSPEDVREI
jgi:lipoprotein-releasing system ATP-binding protein